LKLTQVYEALGTKSINFMDLNLGASSLYRISAPTTPPDARDEVIQRAEAGEMLACAEVKRVVQEKKAKLPSKQPRVASQTPTRRYPEPPEPADGENLWRSWGPGAAIGVALHDFGELVTGRDASGLFGILECAIRSMDEASREKVLAAFELLGRLDEKLRKGGTSDHP
jgi:hypothetical protein